MAHYTLDWSSISGNEQNFYDACCALSALQARQYLRTDENSSDGVGLDCELYDEDHNVESDDEFGANSNDDDILLTEPDTGCEEDAQQSFDARCRKFLDRLAEVLARFRDDRESRRRPTQVQAATHVCSTKLTSHGPLRLAPAVQLVIAKNESLDGEDARFLDTLCSRLSSLASADGVELASIQDHLLDDVFAHVRPRTLSYLRDLLQQMATLAGHTGECSCKLHEHVRRTRDDHSHMHGWRTDSFWKLYAFAQAKVDETAEVKANDGSDTAQQAARLLFDRILTLSTADPDGQTNILRTIVPQLDALMMSLRARMALRSCFHLYASGRSGARSADKAYRTMLFLCRARAAVRAFTNAAVEIKAFTNMSWRGVDISNMKAKKPKVQDLGNSKTRLEGCLLSAMHSLEAKTPRTSMTGHINSIINSKHKHFSSLLTQAKHIHAETQIIANEDRNPRTPEASNVYPYIGCSKRLCYLCELLLRCDGRSKARECHGTLHNRWTVPETYANHKPKTHFQEALSLSYRSLQKAIAAFVMPDRAPLNDPRAEFTVDQTIATLVASPDDKPHRPTQDQFIG